MTPKRNYHDLHITTASIPRTSIARLPFELMVTCTRTAGWELWRPGPPGRNQDTLLAGEYADPSAWLVLDVDGVVIIDSRRKENA